MRAQWRALLSLLLLSVMSGRVSGEENEPEEPQEPQEDDPAEIMNQMDTDQDGKLSMLEIVGEPDGEEADNAEASNWRESFEKVFNNSDTDKDGFISADEL